MPQVAANFRSNDEVAKGANIRGDTVRRYIRFMPEVAALPQSVTVDTQQGVAVEYITRKAG